MFIFNNFLLENSNSNDTNKYETELKELDQIAEEALTSGKYDELGSSSETAALIMAEASTSLQKLYTALLESDLVLESYVRQGREDEAEVMLEGVVDNFFGKLRKIFEDVWAAITKFFNNVRLKMREFFDFGAKWLAKNEANVLKNESKYKTMEFKGFKYDVDKLSADSIPSLNLVHKLIPEYSNKASQIVKDIKAIGVDNDDRYKQEMVELDQVGSVEKILTSIGDKLVSGGKDIKDIGSLKKQYRKNIRGGMDKAEKFKGSEGPDLKKMMNFVKNRNKVLGSIEKEYSMFKKSVGSIIKLIKEAESQAKKVLGEKDKGIVGRVQQICSKTAASLKSSLSIGTGLYAAHTEEIMAAGRQFFSMLKKVASGKNTDPDEDESNADGSDNKEETKTVPDTNSLLNYLYENSAF